MYSENRREYEKKVMQIVEERLVLDFFHKKCYRFDSVKSLKPAQVGTILNDMGRLYSGIFSIFYSWWVIDDW